jgi:hypothetical protein
MNRGVADVDPVSSTAVLSTALWPGWGAAPRGITPARFLSAEIGMPRPTDKIAWPKGRHWMQPSEPTVAHDRI